MWLPELRLQPVAGRRVAYSNLSWYCLGDRTRVWEGYQQLRTYRIIFTGLVEADLFSCHKTRAL
jgi:hypothetical protein